MALNDTSWMAMAVGGAGEWKTWQTVAVTAFLSAIPHLISAFSAIAASCTRFFMSVRTSRCCGGCLELRRVVQRSRRNGDRSPVSPPQNNLTASKPSPRRQRRRAFELRPGDHGAAPFAERRRRRGHSERQRCSGEPALGDPRRAGGQDVSAMRFEDFFGAAGPATQRWGRENNV